MRTGKNRVRTYSLENFFEWYQKSCQSEGLYLETGPLEEHSSIFLPYRSDHYLFVFIREGEFVLNINLRRHHLKKGDIIFSSPDSIKQTVSISPDCEASLLAFRGNYLVSAGVYEKDIDIFSFVSSRISPLINLQKEEFELLAEMITALENKLNTPVTIAYYERIIHHLFAGLIYQIGSLYINRRYVKDFKGTRKDELTLQFLDILKQHHKTERTVIEYARKLNVTPNHLSQTIKDVTGRTAGDLIDDIVMREARLLLNNVDLSIAEVAAALNFKDQFIFSKYFKKLDGRSPREYRKH